MMNQPYNIQKTQCAGPQSIGHRRQGFGHGQVLRVGDSGSAGADCTREIQVCSLSELDIRGTASVGGAGDALSFRQFVALRRNLWRSNEMCEI